MKNLVFTPSGFPRLLLGFIGLLTLAFVAFSCEKEEPASEIPPAAETVSPALSGGQSDLPMALAIMDSIVTFIQQNQTAPSDSLEVWLMEIMENCPTPYLTSAESQQFQQYVASKVPLIKPTMDRVRQEMGEKYNFASGATNDICYTYCLLVIEVECNTNAFMGVCAGLWDCSYGMAPHPCTDNQDYNGPCRNDADCPSGYRCAKWVFKPNECVKTCVTNSDCPAGQKCKKPFGTSFKRCK